MLPANLTQAPATRLRGQEPRRGDVFLDQVLKVGPFVVTENSRGGRDVVHRRRPTGVDFTLDFANFGDVQIEFIDQSNDAPSSYKESLDGGREGLHHIAFWPDDIDAAQRHLEQNGSFEVSAVLALRMGRERWSTTSRPIKLEPLSSSCQ